MCGLKFLFSLSLFTFVLLPKVATVRNLRDLAKIRLDAKNGDSDNGRYTMDLHSPKVIRIGGILPFSTVFQSVEEKFPAQCMGPAADISMEVVRENHLLPQLWNMSFSSRDSHCSSAESMNHAFNYYLGGETNVFFGPICDYAAAPVARQTRFWNMPMITIGAMAQDFRVNKKSEYQLLTRVGPANLHSLADFYVNMFKSLNWTQFKLCYEKSDFADDALYFAADAITSHIINSRIPIDISHHKLSGHDDPEDLLLRVIGHRYSGKLHIYLC